MWDGGKEAADPRSAGKRYDPPRLSGIVLERPSALPEIGRRSPTRPDWSRNNWRAHRLGPTLVPFAPEYRKIPCSQGISPARFASDRLAGLRCRSISADQYYLLGAEY